MSTTIDLLHSLIACDCGITGVRQDWSIILNMANLRDILRPVRCHSCLLPRWYLQPDREFVLTQLFPDLKACHCGGNGERILQRIEDIIIKYPNFNPTIHPKLVKETINYCETCQCVYWNAKTYTTSIVVSSDVSEIESTRFQLSQKLVKTKQGRRIFR